MLNQNGCIEPEVRAKAIVDPTEPRKCFMDLQGNRTQAAVRQPLNPGLRQRTIHGPAASQTLTKPDKEPISLVGLESAVLRTAATGFL